MSSFGGINTALSGLTAHRKVLEIVGHNIANVNTEGFSRRNAELSTAGLGAVPAVFSRYNGNGDGVNLVDVQRIRDGFLERRALTEFTNNGTAFRSSQILQRIEQTFPEPSDSGITAQLASFWGAFDEAANQPFSVSLRSQILENASSLASTFARASADLGSQQRDIAAELDAVAAQVNDLASRVAELNGQVQRATGSGLDAHDLADERDVLIAQLSALTGATTREGEGGTVDVYVGGSALVANTIAQEIKIATGVALTPPLDQTGLNGVQVQWVAGSTPMALSGGELWAMARGVNETIPRYLQSLDGVAQQLVTSVNALHQGGQGMGGAADTNLNFFDPAGTTAASLALSTDVAGQPTRIALAASGGGALDTSVAQSIAGLINSPTGPNVAFNTMVGQLGIETASAIRRESVQQAITVEADAQRKSVSGVNLDEEMTKLVASQRAYEASARLLTAIDEMLDTLINRTGLAGR